MNNLDKQYQTLLQTILDYGIVKSDRTGTGTKSIFGYTIRHNMKEGFPLITTKKMPFRLIVTELLWFLRGDTNIKYLVDNDCHIWDGDAYKNYCEKQSRKLIQGCTYQEFLEKIKTDDEFAKQWGDLGPVYGKQWRAWGGYNKVPSGWNHGSVTSFKDVAKCDQIANSIHLLKTDPDSRRNRVNSWNVGELDQMTLPPCHTDFQFYTRELSLKERMNLCREKLNDTDDSEILLPSDIEYRMNNEWNIPKRAISLMWNQRSVDTFLGLPFNIASYGLLLEIIAKEVNMVPDELIGNLGDTHLYLNHIEQAKEQIGRELTIEERGSLYRKQQNLSDDVELVGSDRDAHRVFDDYGITKRTREPYPLPKLDIHPGMLDYELDKLEIDMFKILDYQSHPHIKAPLSN
jgi:thymidylate synthase